MDLVPPQNVRSNFSPARSAECIYRRRQLLFFFCRPYTASSSCSLPRHTLPLAAALGIVSARNVRSNFRPASSTESLYRRDQVIFFFYTAHAALAVAVAFLDIFHHLRLHWISFRPRTFAAIVGQLVAPRVSIPQRPAFICFFYRPCPAITLAAYFLDIFCHVW
jgi:hypothetical protein